MNVFELVASIALDKSGLEEGLKDSEKEVSGFGAKLKNGLGTAAKVGATAVAAVGAAGAYLTKTIISGASETAAYGDNIDKMSQKLGISAKAYQEWDAILQHSGTSIDGMQRGMMTLSKAVESGSDAFAKLGLTEEQVASMNQEDLFAAVITGLQGMEEGSERAVLAQELLGGAAKELGPLLNTSAEETEAMRQRVHELGGVMSDEAVKAAAAYQDSLQDMQTSFSGMKNSLMSEFMPSITQVMDGLADIFSGDSDSGIEKIANGIDSLVSNISDKLPQFLELGMKILDSLIHAIIQNLPKLLSTSGQLIGQLISGIISYLPVLIQQAPEIVMAIIEGLISAWPSIKSAGIDLINTLWDGISSVISNAWTWGRDIIQNFINGLADNVGALWDSVKNIAQGIRNFLGFSEPKEGPLSNFHTYAPDMMALFAKGIKENEDMVTDQISDSFNFENEISPVINGSRGGSDGGFTIVVQSVLDGKVIGETAYKYQRNMARASG